LVVASNPATACRVRTTVMLRDPVTGKRLLQMAGSTIGATTLRTASNAPAVAWPGAKGARLTVQSAVARSRGITPAVMRRAQVVLVRRIAVDPLQPVTVGNPRTAYRDAFGASSEWPVAP
ncbi:MAG: hypothetical protein ACKOGE_03500, partial [Actinomycetota bacterium]